MGCLKNEPGGAKTCKKEGPMCCQELRKTFVCDAEKLARDKIYGLEDKSKIFPMSLWGRDLCVGVTQWRDLCVGAKTHKKEGSVCWTPVELRHTRSNTVQSCVCETEKWAEYSFYGLVYVLRHTPCAEHMYIQSYVYPI